MGPLPGATCTAFPAGFTPKVPVSFTGLIPFACFALGGASRVPFPPHGWITRPGLGWGTCGSGTAEDDDRSSANDSNDDDGGGSEDGDVSDDDDDDDDAELR